MDNKKKYTSVIVGAGPSGIAAAYLLTERGKNIALYEKDGSVGGLSKTVKHGDFLFDLGGHRLFSKDQKVIRWWQDILGENLTITPRRSNILLNGKFLRYPLRPLEVLRYVGARKALSIIFDYLISKASGTAHQDNFETFMSRRFGKKLYRIFFKSYSEKVWGISCSELSSEWAKERIGGLSLSEVLKDSFLNNGKTLHASLARKFFYPKYGIGSLFETACEKIKERGAEIFLENRLISVSHKDGMVTSLVFSIPGERTREVRADSYIFSIPLNRLIRLLNPPAPINTTAAADSLRFRSLIIVDLILDKAYLSDSQWIYIHSEQLKLARIQNYKNWSPYMVPDARKSSLGLEYFCNENDPFWTMKDSEISDIAKNELASTGLARADEIDDAIVTRIADAYPIYSGNYQNEVSELLCYLKSIKNMKTIGRQGTFKYMHIDGAIISGFEAAEEAIRQSS